ncbi:alpha/beta hydrolase family protein [Ideonella sp. BN130291]|uniref:alpha/beta hydrolase family protein n=1 Tax=Ideonella sp. BN130291 TaxID=3112940 RepID=UPI002E2618AA|nr:alpha/beta fold hydrolase [Ideonella sp. BN130291]
MQMVRFAAVDGFELSGSLYGDASAAQAALLIVPAMGVSQRYYAEFADWLATQGFVVFSFDYRGMGASRPTALKKSLKGLDADVVTWAEKDTAAALAWLDAQVGPQMQIHWLGHSLGGQIFGLVPNRERISRMVTVGTGSGYWLQNSPRLRNYVWWLWYFVTPVALPLFGYFPGKALKKVGDLPHGVMAQWRRWCLHRDYLMSEPGTSWRERYAAIRTPILSLSFTDDEFMSAQNTASLHGFYANAPREMRRIAPADLGVQRIGHFGFFRKHFAQTLWPQVPQWLAN